MSGKQPSFSTWDHTLLAELAHDLWAQNIQLREVNEQLRMDNKDLSKINRQLLTQGAKDDTNSSTT